MLSAQTSLVSKEFLHLNSCDIQRLWDKDYYTVREFGRPDYHILYITEGQCLVESQGKNEVVNPGELFLIPPNEKHKYSFKASEKPVSCYLHFSGTGCEKLLSEVGFYPDRILRLKKSRTLENIFEKIFFSIY